MSPVNRVVATPHGAAVVPSTSTTAPAPTMFQIDGASAAGTASPQFGCALVDNHGDTLLHECNVALGFRGRARTMPVSIASPGYNGQGVRDKLKEIREAGQSPVPWISPDGAAMAAGTIDPHGIAAHPSVDDLIDALTEHAGLTNDQSIAQVCGEAGNFRLSPSGAPLGRWYDSPAVWYSQWSQLVDRLCAIKLKDGRRLILPSAGWEPGGGPGFRQWFTAPVLERLAAFDGFLDVHPYDALPKYAASRWAIFLDFLAWARSNNIPSAILECGSIRGETVPAGQDRILDGDFRRENYLKPLTAAVVNSGVRVWLYPSNERWAGYAAQGWVTSRYAPSLPPHAAFPPAPGKPWLGSPEMTAYLKKTLNNPIFVKLPLA